MTVKKRADESPEQPTETPSNPDESNPDGVQETPAGPVSIDQGPVEPESQEPTEDGRAVTIGDVAALNGIGLAPDVSIVDTAAEADVFVSEGMRNDLEHYGWAVDPNTGRKVVKDQ
jgi:hypothetical protein